MKQQMLCRILISGIFINVKFLNCLPFNKLPRLILITQNSEYTFYLFFNLLKGSVG